MSVRVAAALFRRLVWPLVLVLAAAVSARASAAGRRPQRIVAVGDLHGDFQAWLTIARAAGLIDAPRPLGRRQDHARPARRHHRPRTGYSLKIIRNLQQLQKEAPRTGGRVIVVLGNHEAMNLLGDYRYTTPGEYAAFADGQSAARREHYYELTSRNRGGLPSARSEAVRRSSSRAMDGASTRSAGSSTGSPGARRASSANGRRANPAVAKIGDTLFVHGGLSAEYSKLPMDEINRRVATAMAAADESPKSILTDPLGPLWYRGLVGRDADAEAERTENARAAPAAQRPTIDEELSTVLAAYGAQRLVIAPHADPLRNCDHQRRPPRAHRYRDFALLRRAAHLARDHRRPDDPACRGEAGAMKSRLIATFASFALAIAAPACAQQSAKPLFAAADPIHIVIQAPLSTIIRKRESEGRIAGTLTDPAGQSLPISLALRGITRRTSERLRLPAAASRRSPHRRPRLRCSPARAS